MKTKRNRIWIFLFILPTVVLFGVIFAYSLMNLVYTSFYDWAIGWDMVFIGFDNYRRLFQTRDFIAAINNTLIWVALQTTVHVFIGLVVALILFKRQFYWKFVRTAYMLPNIISSAALGMLWMLLFNAHFGGVNNLIRLLGFEDFNHNWFMHHSTAFWAVSMIWLPYAAVVTILILSEITAIDESIFEAAKIDGASDFKLNVYILVPLLRNILATCMILAATSTLQRMDIIFMTTRGGPGNRTLNMAFYVYRTAMVDNNFGLANAAGTLMVLFGSLLIGLIFWLFKMGKSQTN